MESKSDTKEIMSFIQKSKKKMKELDAEFERQIKGAEDKLSELQGKLKLKDETIEKHIKEEEKLHKDIKMFNSIIRIPRLCSEF